MDFNEYQQLATRTSSLSKEKGDEYALMYFCMGLAGEAGELIEKIKKVIRNDSGVMSNEKREQIKYELGDVLWYLSQLARMSNVSLDDVATGNIAKLADRAKRGVIKSEGDAR
ncbi:MAG TPA: nucleoside triphosphate pyrophosphohydrolase family protein [Candidatus Paceibacterota bacterium]|nr:nucleoside triphosphate pyrophosphohydrolase family protein [Candidatus Paceibacterota bacterium]